jgi:hypothetical protein
MYVCIISDASEGVFSGSRLRVEKMWYWFGIEGPSRPKKMRSSRAG